ncbi:Mannosyl-oligosaccharide glucosidase [Frankliniella fusca]|uniref:Mannosyl-oligosaccharide glucosidase n=1 Tax=Frankliniella fusca TaxID=407009 RepID=A0AAE1LA06_9NEOP|nr:Mannosyl-oligosaccharide glucosidase [Frankliniella fusca]
MAKQRKHGRSTQGSHHNGHQDTSESHDVYQALVGTRHRQTLAVRQGTRTLHGRSQGRSHSDAHEYEDRYSAHLKHVHQHKYQKHMSLTRKFLTVSAIAFTGGVLTLIGLLTYNGYLETRVNTPFDKYKVVGQSGLSVPDRYWGSYRPGVYFGLKTRDPHSPVMGLMWYFDSHVVTGFAGVRHWCEQHDNLRYGWKEHDGRFFGVQDIIDHPYNITTSFFKKPGGRRGGDWSAFINVSALTPDGEGQGVSLMFYMALDDKTAGSITTNEMLSGIDGYTDELGDFTVRFERHFGEVYQMSHLNTRISGLEKIKEITEHSLHAVRDSTRRVIVLPGTKLHATRDNPNPLPNLSVQKIDAKIPFGIEIKYKSGKMPVEQSQQKSYDIDLNTKRKAFHQKFDLTFKLKEKGFDESMQEFAKAAFSNMIGGVAYFYGSSLVQSIHNPTPVPYWKAPLYTAVPSRSFFPRGFLWDEGFHALLLLEWDREITLDIMCHWFDLMNIQGWIPREQILGAEALAKVPEEFVVQHNQNANPPTFFLTLQQILRKHKNEIIANPDYLDSLERLYPRLRAWFSWFNTTQIGTVPTTYRWRGRDPDTLKFLNPKTLTSGLDDYPRASHPTSLERHIDLRCWMALGAQVLSELSDLLGHNGEKFRNTYLSLSDQNIMDELHWSEKKSRYADYGLHTDAVTLLKPSAAPRAEYNNNEFIRVVLMDPEYGFVDAQFGYINLFPFLLQILEPNSKHLEKVLNDIRNPSLLWTQYGLRSLSPNSPLYLKRNTEHDPPYWRGQIWINMNYLACRALYHYANVEGPHSKLAGEIYARLRNNLIKNLYKEFVRTGFLWENYDDRTGEGKGCHPFNGWTALVTLIMAEIY